MNGWFCNSSYGKLPDCSMYVCTGERIHANYTFVQICQSNLKVGVFITRAAGVETVIWPSVQQEQAGTKKGNKGDGYKKKM